VANYKENCKCQSTYMGDLCEYTETQFNYLVTKNVINGVGSSNTTNLTSLDSNTLVNMQLILIQNTSFVTPYLLNSLYNLTVKQVNESINANTNLTYTDSKNLLNLLDITMMMSM